MKCRLCRFFKCEGSRTYKVECIYSQIIGDSEADNMGEVNRAIEILFKECPLKSLDKNHLEYYNLNYWR